MLNRMLNVELTIKRRKFGQRLLCPNFIFLQFHYFVFSPLIRLFSIECMEGNEPRKTGLFVEAIKLQR